MENHQSQPLLLLGCQRSGTTLLAAMLGGHSEINMLFESVTKDTFRLIGKRYNGNKLLAYRQIRMNQRASRFGHLINRIVNLNFGREPKPHKLRPFPTGRLTLQDYIDRDAKIITIVRKKEEVVSSIVKRTKMSEKQASREYDLVIQEINKVTDRALNITFKELVGDPEGTLKTICNYLDLEFEPRMLKGPEYNFVYPEKSIISSKSTENESCGTTVPRNFPNIQSNKNPRPYGPRVFHIRFSATGLRAPVHAELLYLLQSLREPSTYLHSHSHLQRWYFLLQSFLKELHHEHPSPQRYSCLCGPFQY